MLTGPYVDLVHAVVDQAAAWYARRVWWVRREDLVQEGWVVALTVLLHHDEPPENLRGLLWVAVTRHFSRYCASYASPVTSPCAGRDRCVAVCVDDAQLRSSPGAGAELAVLRAELEQRVDDLRKEWIGKIDMRLAEAVIDVLVHGSSPAEAAAAHGVAVDSVYSKTRPLRRRIVRDQRARGILEQIEEARSL